MIYKHCLTQYELRTNIKSYSQLCTQQPTPAQKSKGLFNFMYFTFIWKIVICEHLRLDITRVNKKYEDSVTVNHILFVKFVTNRYIYARIFLSLIYNIWLYE